MLDERIGGQVDGTSAAGGLSAEEYSSLKEACGELPPARGNYHESDFLKNLFLTVLDYQLQSEIVRRAMQHYEEHGRRKAPDVHALRQQLAAYPDTQEGNHQLAVDLWGYQYANRVAQLRRLVAYFDSVGVDDDASLATWAAASTFERDFQGKVPGLGFAVYKWLVMRVGVQTVKPDLHVRAFVKALLGRDLPDRELVAVLESVARDLGLPPRELDWRIWEHRRGRG